MEGQRPEKTSDEIDIGAVFSRIGDAFGRGWMNFMRFLATMRRIPFEHKVSFSLIIVTSLLIGLFFTFQIRRNYYESTMILNCDYINIRLAKNAIEKLDNLAREADRRGLSKALGVSDSVAQNIAGISVKSFVEEADVVEIEVLKEQLRAAQTPNNQQVIEAVIERIELENRHSFEITVRTFNPNIVADIQEGIIHYFTSNPYIQRRIEEHKRSLQVEAQRLNGDIAKIDSLKSVVIDNYRVLAQQRNGSNNVILSDKSVADPVQIYNQSLSIYKRLREINNELFLQKDFEIVDGLTEFSEPASASMTKMIFYSLLIGIAVAYLDIALRNFNKYLADLK